MSQWIRLSLNNKFAVWLLTIIVTVAGLYSGMNMKLETIPDINAPVVNVTTLYPGAPPKDVVEEVTKPIEQKVQSLPGVKTVSSSSFQNASSIQIEYSFDKDMDQAKDEVREAVADVSLPEEAQEPEVSRLSFNAFPVLSLSVTNEELSSSELTEVVEKEIVPALEGIEGVHSVDIAGQQVDEMRLSFKKKQLKKYGLDEQTVREWIRGSSRTYPLGLFQFGDTEKVVEIDGKITSLKDLKNLEIPVTPPQQPGGAVTGQTPPGSKGIPQAASGFSPGKLPTVPLQEIAEIEEGQKAESISRTNGKESIGVQVVKSPDANTVDVVNGVKEEIAALEDEIDGMDIVTIFDQGEPIEESVSTMVNKALFGAIFAFLIILLFLRNMRTTLISLISIPLSLLIALLILKELDITLNIMTLGAMTVAIGRVVDDSIVVIENIYRRMSLKEEQLKGKELIRAATREMFVPILSSTVVTVAVFLPLGLVEGPVGELFLPFALTIVTALSASLLVAVTVVPMMADSMFKRVPDKNRKREVSKNGKLAAGYRRVLEWSLNHKGISFGLAALMLAGSLFLIPVIGTSFLPSEGEKILVATYKPEPGQTKEDVVRLAEETQRYLEDREGVKTIQYSVGGDNPIQPGSSNEALFFVRYEDDFDGFDAERQKVLDDLTGRTEKGTWEYQNAGGATAGSNSITLYVYGEDMDEIRPVVDDIINIVEGNDTYTNVDSSISESFDQYTLIPDREKLSQYGLSAAQVSMMLNNLGDRPVLTTIEKNGKDVNVYLQTDKKGYDDEADLKDTTLQTPLGSEVALEELMRVEKGKSPDTVTRRDGKIYASVTMDVTTEDVGKASADLKNEVSKLDLPSSVEVEFGGVTEQIEESFVQLGMVMLAAVAIVYLILVMTFGGGLAPLAILFSLPFSVIGGLLGLLISGETVSVSALIGALMLIGIVVTNAIVLIDRVIRKEKEGLTTREALLEAGPTRLRPILMTALATIGALLPLAFGLEGGGLISRGLGVTVIGGLTSSTLLTLVIVPVVYEFFARFRRKSPVHEYPET